jgi:hypothetical protein
VVAVRRRDVRAFETVRQTILPPRYHLSEEGEEIEDRGDVSGEGSWRIKQRKAQNPPSPRH